MDNKLKTYMKKNLSEKQYRYVREIKSLFMARYIFKKDKKQFLKNYSKKNCKDIDQIKARIIFYGHSLEKGLSREDVRLGFGREVMLSLLHYMNKFLIYSTDYQDSVYVNGASIINEYLLFHESKHFKIDYIPEVYISLINSLRNIDIHTGGSDVRYLKNLSKPNAEVGFKNLALNRVSIREYSSEQIDLKKIQEAVEISMKSPSVCNRQSARVYVITDKEKIKQALHVQGGFRGYQLPPCLLLVTTDTRYFINVNERNQRYVDGGIFSMSLLYSLEYYNLGTCALNTMFDPMREKKTRDILGVPDNENFIMYISVGNKKERYKFPKSFRLRGEEILKYV
ncbi:nitroreductase family protein, partial [Enterococcus faecium]|uniref:nitroreductase family protein n=1 Tax=Enterococcus faecium TaxID=1352 RepID=UPI0023B2E22E